MAKSKYFQKKKGEELPEGVLTVEEALSVATQDNSPIMEKIEPVQAVAVPLETAVAAPVIKIRQAYDVFFDRTDMSYKIVVIHYDDSNHSKVIKTEITKLDKNQAKAASTVQKVFAMKFLKRT